MASVDDAAADGSPPRCSVLRETTLTCSIEAKEFRSSRVKVVKRWFGDFGDLLVVFEACSGRQGRGSGTFGAAGFRVRVMVKCDPACSCLVLETLCVGTGFSLSVNHDFSTGVVYRCHRVCDLAWAF